MMTLDFERYSRRYANDACEVTELAVSVQARLSWRTRRGRKQCTACKRQLPPGAFGMDGRRRDGLEPRCRECRRRGRANG